MDKELISGLKREDFQAVVQGKQTDLYTMTNSNGVGTIVHGISFKFDLGFPTGKARWPMSFKAMTA